MKLLAVIIFAEFAAEAILVPPLVLLRRTIRGRLVLALVAPALITVPLLVGTWLGLWSAGESSWATNLLIARIQLLAVAFSIAMAGLSSLAARRFPFGGPAVVAVLALLVLGSPMWADVLLNAHSDAVRDFTLEWVVRTNPLLSVAGALQFDWTHSHILYNLTRIGEDLAYTSPRVLVLAAWYGGLGILTLIVSLLIREHGRRSEYLPDPGERV